MLVDDDERLRLLLERILDDDGFAVTGSVGTAEAAVTTMATADPDVVVLDYTLPDGDGLSVADEIRLLRPHQAVIVFSSIFDLSLQREVENRGFAYIEKVDGIDVLEGAIRAAAGP